EQSYREIIPEICEPSGLEAIIDGRKNYSVKLVAYEEEAKKDYTTYRFSEELQKLRKNDEIVMLIGNEGGITSEEVDILKIADFLIVKFGNCILRTEMASLYAVSSISYQFE